MTEREKKIIKFFKLWEGGYADIPEDTGGCTMSGVTIGTFRQYYGKNKTCDDLQKLTDEQWLHIFYKGFYNKIKADGIKNDSICLMICDFCWMTGVKTAIRKIQRCLGVMDDGIVGPVTLAAINQNDKFVFNQIKYMRSCHFESIVMNQPKKKKFLKGWLRRLNSIKFEESVSFNTI